MRRFCGSLLEQKNAGRRKRLEEELAVLGPLPPRRLESFTRMRVQVSQGSLVRVKKNVYSVQSRLIGEQVDVRIYAEQHRGLVCTEVYRTLAETAWCEQALHQLPTRDRLARPKAGSV